MPNLWRDKFDANEDFVARRDLTLDDTSLTPGDDVPKAVLSPRRLRQLYDHRSIVFKRVWLAYHDEEASDIVQEPDPIQIVAPVAPIEPEPVIVIEAPVIEPLAVDDSATVEEPVTVETELPAAPVAPVVTQLPGLPGVETVDPEAAELEQLRKDAEDLDIAVDGRWGAKRLQKEIDKALSAK